MKTLIAAAALILGAAGVSAEPISSQQLRHEYQQCMTGSVPAFGQKTAGKYCGCLVEELRDNFSLQQWLTLNGEAQRIINAGGGARDIYRQLSDYRDLVTICRFRADLPNW